MIKKCLVEKAEWFNPEDLDLLLYKPVNTQFSSFDECISFYEDRRTFKNEYNIAKVGSELYISNSFHGKFAWMVRFYECSNNDNDEKQENNIRFVSSENQI